jgi:hypothetical protein
MLLLLLTTFTKYQTSYIVHSSFGTLICISGRKLSHLFDFNKKNQRVGNASRRYGSKRNFFSSKLFFWFLTTDRSTWSIDTENLLRGKNLNITLILKVPTTPEGLRSPYFLRAQIGIRTKNLLWYANPWGQLLKRGPWAHTPSLSLWPP